MSKIISGNYDVTDRELAIVKEIFRANKIDYKKIEKYEFASDGDILVTLPNDKKYLIEVKEEDYETRFSKYGDIGIDLVSSFKFYPNVNPLDWKGLKNGRDVFHFFNQIMRDDPSFKGGKISYSKSDLWLFFSALPNGHVQYYSFFKGDFMQSNMFKNYLINNCKFAVNNKPSTQLSFNDTTNSAVFYINHNDKILKENEFDIKTLKTKKPDGYSGDGLAGGPSFE